MVVLAIVADAWEQRSGVPRLLRGLGARVTREALAAGDYVVAPNCLVERKSVRDLHLSLIEGRLWRQLGALRRASDERYLLVEGRDLLGPVAPDSVVGALLAANDLGITVIRSTDTRDSARWLFRMAHRRQGGAPVRIRPTYAQRPKAPPEHAAAAVLAAVPTISHELATRLLQRFGTVADVAAASPTEWMQVLGVGERRSAALEAALQRRPNA